MTAGVWLLSAVVLVTLAWQLDRRARAAQAGERVSALHDALSAETGRRLKATRAARDERLRGNDLGERLDGTAAALQATSAALAEERQHSAQVGRALTAALAAADSYAHPLDTALAVTTGADDLSAPSVMSNDEWEELVFGRPPALTAGPSSNGSRP